MVFDAAYPVDLITHDYFYNSVHQKMRNPCSPKDRKSKSDFFSLPNGTGSLSKEHLAGFRGWKSSKAPEDDVLESTILGFEA